MAESKVTVTLPSLDIYRSDATFEAFDPDGNLIGVLYVRGSAVGWRAAHSPVLDRAGENNVPYVSFADLGAFIAKNGQR